jgi:hypothetical protein
MGLLRFTATVSLLQLPFLVTHAPVDSLHRSLSPLIVLLFEIGERAGRRIHGKVGCSDLADTRGFNFRKKAMCPSLLRVGQFRRPSSVLDAQATTTVYCWCAYRVALGDATWILLAERYYLQHMRLKFSTRSAIIQPRPHFSIERCRYMLVAGPMVKEHACICKHGTVD